MSEISMALRIGYTNYYGNVFSIGPKTEDLTILYQGVNYKYKALI